MASSSSSEATESENSCNERYDYEKSSNSATAKRNGCGGVGVAARSATSRSGSEKALDRVAESLDDQPPVEPVADLDFFVDRTDESSLRDARYQSERYIDDRYIDDRYIEERYIEDPYIENRYIEDRYIEDRLQQQLRTGKRTNQRPASIKSAGSYDGRDPSSAAPIDSGGRTSGGQREHYMIPTHHEPNRSSDKRTVSLFNPDFLPNFNDMLMYVGRGTEPEANRDFYRRNLDDDETNWQKNSPSIVDPSKRYEKNSCPRIDITDDLSRNIDVAYASLRLADRVGMRGQPTDQECDNIYAPVGLQALQAHRRIDYDC